MVFPDIRAVARHALFASAFYSGGVVLSLGGLGPLAVAPFMIAVAVCVARRNRAQAVGLMLVAGCVALTALDGVQAILFCVLWAGVGFPLGHAMLCRWSYGLTVAVVTGAAFAVFLIHILSAWSTWTGQGSQAYESITAQLSNAGAPSDEAVAGQWLKVSQWLYAHWADVSVGAVFSSVLLWAALAVSVTTWWLRRTGIRRPSIPQADGWRPKEEPAVPGPAFGPLNDFRVMRPPDWLVWLAIVAALAWFAEQRWPNETLRVVCWNASVSLAAVYWLNGLSIMAYVIRAIGAHPIAPMLVVVTVLCFGAWLLCLIGLFDTWGEFRPRMDALIAAARARMNANPDDE